MQAGEEVLCLDNATGRKANVRSGGTIPGLSSFATTSPSVKLEVDRIWHLACPLPIHYQTNPVKTAKISFLGTYNMLGLARRVKARLLLASPVRCMAIRRCTHNRRTTAVA